MKWITTRNTECITERIGEEEEHTEIHNISSDNRQPNEQTTDFAEKWEAENWKEGSISIEQRYQAWQRTFITEDSCRINNNELTTAGFFLSSGKQNIIPSPKI